MVYAHFRIGHFVVILSCSDVMTWNTRTNETIFANNKLRQNYFEESELPTPGTGRDCGKVHDEVFYLAKNGKVIKIWFNRDEYCANVVFTGAKALALDERLGLAAVITEHDEMVIFRTKDKSVVKRQQTSLLAASKYTTIAFLDGGSVIITSVQYIKKYKPVTENVLHLYSHNLELITTRMIELASPQSRPQ